MKTVGLIGGMSWESTLPYYEIINKGVNRKLGRNHSAKCIVYSVDFQEIEELQYSGDWNRLNEIIIKAGLCLKAAGADFIVLCTNTMHKVVDDFDNTVGLPLIHIADAIGEEITNNGIKRIGLLGTIFTMEQDFYKEKLISKYNLEVVIPDKNDREVINDIIYKELVKGIIKESSKEKYFKIMDKMKAEYVQGIILGCTEIGLLVDQYSIPLFDSTKIHATKAIEMMLEKIT
ncbi:MAG: aspartate/glutamate racemase family protein [Treponema sp.]